MISLNLGIFSSRDIQSQNAYGLLRSSFLPLDVCFLTVQGVALGILFGHITLGVVLGLTASITDRLFSPFVNRLPGNSYSFIGIPLGLKNIVLAVASTAVSILILKSF